jgi:cell division protein ZapE
MDTLTDAYSARIAAGKLTADPVQLAVLPELERVRAELALPVKKGLFKKAPEPVRGVYLWGGVGRGKSMLMDLLYATVTVPKQRRHFHAFMQWVHAEIGAARKRGVTDPIAPVADKLIAQVRFLAFDEMQITDITDAMLVGRLFERLFAAGVTVVTTSNRPPWDLYKEGLNREVFLPFIRLIEDRCKVVELASDTDHRQGRLQGVQRYFTPLNQASRAAMAQIWEDIAHGQGHPEILRVHGRNVEIPGFYNGSARASFYDLCGRPLGPADYLALAGIARVLLIDEIPQLGSDNFNEARRFVTLIDALYEARVQVFCSAAARPEMLYVEGEGTFEFGRTASRLIEMQAADWGPPDLS